LWLPYLRSTWDKTFWQSSRRQEAFMSIAIWAASGTEEEHADGAVPLEADMTAAVVIMGDCIAGWDISTDCCSGTGSEHEVGAVALEADVDAAIVVMVGGIALLAVGCQKTAGRLAGSSRSETTSSGPYRPSASPQ
jgi:hypothetical protein